VPPPRERRACGWDQAAPLIERLLRLPPEARAYHCSEEQAARHFGVDQTAADALVALGLPCRVLEGCRYFEKGDLHYIGLRLGSAAGYRLATRLTARSLARLSGRSQTRVRIQYVPRVPVKGLIDVRLPSGRHLTQAHASGNAPVADIEVELSASWPAAGSGLTAVLNSIALLDFCLIPHLCRAGTAIATRTGLAECSTSAQLLVELATAAGWQARFCEGVLVSMPYSTEHSWAEVHLDGIWVPFDPLLIAHLQNFGQLDPDEWPPYRSLGGALVRYGPQSAPIAAPLVQGAGGHVAVSLLTEIVS
jgi:Transglutaminase-like superfamily